MYGTVAQTLRRIQRRWLSSRCVGVWRGLAVGLGRVSVPQSFWDDLRAYVGFGPDDEAICAALAPAFEPHAPAIAEHFYACIHAEPNAARILTGGQTQIDRLQHTLAQWMVSGLRGPYDAVFLARRWRIGVVHVQIGLPQQYMVAAIDVMRRDYREVLTRIALPNVSFARAYDALERLLDLELALMLRSYADESHAQVESKTNALETALRQSEGTLRTLVDTVQALLLMLDAAGRVLMVNRAAAQAVGGRAGTMVGQPFAVTYVAPLHRPRFEQAVAQARSGEHSHVETQVLQRGEDGTMHRRAISWSIAALTSETGQSLYLSGLDVTNVRQLERRTRIAEKLAAVGTISAGLAHEIRNPLNAAGLQLQLLERKAKRAEHEAYLGPIATVRSEIHRLSTLVTDFLTFARPARLQASRVDLRDIVDAVVALEQPLAQDMGVTLEGQVPTLPVVIEADPYMLKQVVLNLVANALEATPAGGSVVVTADPHAEHGGASIRVRDTGQGMAPEVLHRVFEPFFTTKDGGTGLGMAISHSLVERHGGDLWVESSLGRGTTFTIDLPPHPATPSESKLR